MQIIENEIEKQSKRYFSERGAITPDTAITVDANHFQQYLKPYGDNNTLNTKAYIVKTPSGKYYFDEELLRSTNADVTVVYLTLSFVLLIIVAFITVLVNS